MAERLRIRDRKTTGNRGCCNFRKKEIVLNWDFIMKYLPLYQTAESLFLLVVFYLMILLPVSLAGSLLERRLRYAGCGT